MKSHIKEAFKIQKESTRLNKFLSESGVCSRREADRLIESGKVKVDGKRAVVGMQVEPHMEVLVGKKTIKRGDEMIMLAVNKPPGIVCTEEQRERKNIINFLNYPTRITYIGRLDKDSQGLLLMTNNGDVINKMMRAGNHHEKEYKVTVNRPITKEFLQGMSEGVPILETITRPCTVKGIGKYTFQIVLTQGLNRQIRRMCEYFNYKVERLERTRIMNIKLGGLQLGAYRMVSNEELEALYKQIQASSNETVKG